MDIMHATPLLMNLADVTMLERAIIWLLDHRSYISMTKHWDGLDAAAPSFDCITAVLDWLVFELLNKQTNRRTTICRIEHLLACCSASFSCNRSEACHATINEYWQKWLYRSDRSSDCLAIDRLLSVDWITGVLDQLAFELRRSNTYSALIWSQVICQCVLQSLKGNDPFRQSSLLPLATEIMPQSRPALERFRKEEITVRALNGANFWWCGAYLLHWLWLILYTRIWLFHSVYTAHLQHILLHHHHLSPSIVEHI
jgi:hypothetical protein